MYPVIVKYDESSNRFYWQCVWLTFVKGHIGQPLLCASLKSLSLILFLCTNQATVEFPALDAIDSSLIVYYWTGYVHWLLLF